MKPQPRSADGGAPPLSISVVVPVYNEGQGLSGFLDALTSVLRASGWRFEVICVDDGSTDNSLDVLLAHQSNDPHVKVVALSRNFGKDAALLAGLRDSRGDAVVVMDSDMQHPPESIPDLVGAWLAGHDVVYGVRTEGAASSRFRRLSGRVFHAIYNRVSEAKLHGGDSDFRLLSRRAVKAVTDCARGPAFVRGLAAWVGFSSTDVPYRERERLLGTSKWTTRSLTSMALFALLHAGSFPIRFVGVVAALLGCLSCGTGALLLALAPEGTNRVLLSSVLVLGGVQLLCLAVVSQYMTRGGESAGRPAYVVGARYGFGRGRTVKGRAMPDPPAASPPADHPAVAPGADMVAAKTDVRSCLSTTPFDAEKPARVS